MTRDGLIPDGFLYIGSEDCRKATCNEKQGFPGGPSPYCLGHSWAEWKAEDGGSP